MINRKALINLCLITIKASSMEYDPTKSDLRSQLAMAQAKLTDAKDMYERHAIRNEIRDIMDLIYPTPSPYCPHTLHTRSDKHQPPIPTASATKTHTKLQMLQQITTFLRK